MSACERHTHRVLPLGRSTPGARRRAHTGRARVAESRAPTSLRRVAAGGAVLGPAALVKRVGTRVTRPRSAIAWLRPVLRRVAGRGRLGGRQRRLVDLPAVEPGRLQLLPQVGSGCASALRNLQGVEIAVLSAVRRTSLGHVSTRLSVTDVWGLPLAWQHFIRDG